MLYDVKINVLKNRFYKFFSSNTGQIWIELAY
jgi:hypothetical protein